MAGPVEAAVRGAISPCDRLATSSGRGRFTVARHTADGLVLPDGQWSRPPLFPDGSGGLVSSADDVVAFGRMLMRGGSPVLKAAAAAEMTRDQLTAAQRANLWPGFSFLEDRGWGYGLSVLGDGRCTWEGGLGTAWSNVPSQAVLQDVPVVGDSCSSAVGSGKPIGIAWRPPGSRGCSVSSLAVEPCATLADHPGENRLSAMPVVQHHSRHGRRAEVP